MKKTILAVFLILSLLISPTPSAQASGTFTFYGKLRGANNVLITGNKSMVFNIYNSPSGGGLLAGGQTQTVAVTNGHFSVDLPAVDTAVVYIEVTVDGNTFPRIKTTLPINKAETDWIDAGKIKAGAITTAKIADSAVTNAKLSPGSFSNITGTGTLSSISVTGGSITGITDLAIADGGTGQSTKTTAFDALSPLTTQGDVLYYDGTDNVRLAKGTAGQVLTMNAGVTAPEWQTASGSGANTALSNLASVAVNTSLTSDTDNTDDLGTDSIGWKNIYTRAVKFDGSTSGTTTVQATAAAGTTTLTLPAATDTLVGKATTDTLTNKTLTSPVIGTSPTAAGATWTDLGTVTTADINGGTIDGTTIGGASAGAGTFTTLSASSSIAVTNYINFDNTLYNTRLGYQAGNAITTGNYNTAAGYQSLYSNTTGNYNTATGYLALYANTTGADNTATGYGALYSNTTGYDNTATGIFALYSNTTGLNNTATGLNALRSNTTGIQNTAIGANALYANTTGDYNTATGNYALRYNTTGTNNTANGYQALYTNTTGANNTATGYYALYANTIGYGNTANGYYALYANFTGNYNTATGYQALYSNTTGVDNTANGYGALYSNTANNNTATGRSALYANTTGSSNTATGYMALLSNTTGASNTATGSSALYSNTTGASNTATGSSALYSNTTGRYNTATGLQALYSNTTGEDNTATGYLALAYNTTGQFNTATGYLALYSNTTGNVNTATGLQALAYNTTGSNNTATGYNALYSNTTGANNTALGHQAGYTATPGNANTTGTNNTFIGYNSGPGTATQLTNATAIGNGALVFDSNAMTLGDSNITKVGFGVSASPAQAFQLGAFANNAYCNSSGTWTNGSSREYKQQITSFGDNDYENILKTLDAVDVSFYKFNVEVKEKGKGAKQHIGIIAEDAPDIITDENKKGLPTTDAIGFLLAVAKAQQKQINLLSGKEIQKELKETEITKEGDLAVRNDSRDRDLLFEVNQGGSPVTAMRIDGSTGNVGIGLNVPHARLDVNGTIKTSGSDSPWTTAEFGKGIELIQGNTVIWDEEGGAIARGITVMNDKFYILRSADADTSSEPIYDMVIDENGNIGLGTVETEDYKLSVAGNTNIQGTISAEKGFSGYVINKFINGSGSSLKRGDLVKIKPAVISQFTGKDNLIPISEVTLTEADDEYGVVGIVLGVSNTDLDVVQNGEFTDVVTQGAFALCKVTGTVHGGNWLISSAGGYAKEAASASANRAAMALESYIPGESPSEYIAVLIK